MDISVPCGQNTSHQFALLGKRHEALRWEITDRSEVQYALQVIRLRPHDRVLVFDGEGWRAEAVVLDGPARQVTLQIHSETFHDKPTEKILLLGALDGQKTEKLIPSLSELGLTQLWLFLDAKDAAYRTHEKKITRCTDIARQSIKQCRRPYPLSIRAFASLGEAAEPLLQMVDKNQCFILDHEGLPTRVLHERFSENPEARALIVGPERGIDRQEREVLREKYNLECVSVGGYILQATTASLVAAYLLSNGT